MDIVILHKGKLKLRRILISAIANTVANKYDGARIWPWALSIPESRLLDLLFPLAASWFLVEWGEWVSPSDPDTWRGRIQARVKKDLPFSLVLELRVQGVRLRKQKHLRKDLEPLFHVSFTTSLTGMGQRQALPLQATLRVTLLLLHHWRVPGVFIHQVLTMCQAQGAHDRTR